VLPIAWTAVFDTTSSAFILASAECDLQLTFFRKGVIVACPYIGTQFKLELIEVILYKSDINSFFIYEIIIIFFLITILKIIMALL